MKNLEIYLNAICNRHTNWIYSLPYDPRFDVSREYEVEDFNRTIRTIEEDGFLIVLCGSPGEHTTWKHSKINIKTGKIYSCLTNELKGNLFKLTCKNFTWEPLK
jgi:hypothetical protein